MPVLFTMPYIIGPEPGNSGEVISLTTLSMGILMKPQTKAEIKHTIH